MFMYQSVDDQFPLGQADLIRPRSGFLTLLP